MINYSSQKQLSIFDFKTEFVSKLNPENRWVKLANLLDWDKLASVYLHSLSSNMGAPGIDARIIIGALIIKHIENKDDRGTIEAIQENPYMQYFLGFDGFTDKPVFDPSLFVSIRKRLGNTQFDKMNAIIIAKALNIKIQSEDNTAEKAAKPEENSKKTDQKPKNKGKLQMDATVADANIKYPTDLGLLNKAREISEEIIDKVFITLQLDAKPRTYRRKARALYLKVAKNKNKTKKIIRKSIKEQLGFIKRNLGSIAKIVDNNPTALTDLSNAEYRKLLVINELYRQQEHMYRNKIQSIDNRIVSIHQPHIRPIVRGKEHRKVEFGAKIQVILVQGYTRINKLDYEAFNEGTCLKQSVEDYKSMMGHYPEVVQTDDIYMNRTNRAYLKENGIRHTGRPLGRKPKAQLSKYQKKKLQQERNERNHIEGKFGQGKRKYGLNKIMAKLANTQESAIAAILFVMNILKLSKDIFVSFFKVLFFDKKIALGINPKAIFIFASKNSIYKLG